MEQILNIDYLFSMLSADGNNLFPLVPIFLSIVSGVIVGFSLGLIGGGGSILAVPLLVYVIGTDTHVAIGTSALAVASNALINLLYRIGKGCIKIKGGILFAIPGALGTLLGAQLGLATPSENLLAFFALFMIATASWMLRENIKRSMMSQINKEKLAEHGIRGRYQGQSSSDLTRHNDIICNNEPKRSYSSSIKAWSVSIIGNLIQLPHRLSHISVKDNKKKNGETATENGNSNTSINTKILFRGFLVGITAGYFGIGGGFLIVPVLMHTISGLNVMEAIGTSLISISIFGFVTATKYVFVGQIDWFITMLFIIGGTIGGMVGTRLSHMIPSEILIKAFATILTMVGLYIILNSVI